MIWYGYVTLRQPVPCSGNNPGSNCGEGCIGFVDLLTPSKVKSVNDCIKNGYNQYVSGQVIVPYTPGNSGLPTGTQA